MSQVDESLLGSGGEHAFVSGHSGQGGDGVGGGGGSEGGPETTGVELIHTVDREPAYVAHLTVQPLLCSAGVPCKNHRRISDNA